jgi:hypothetical protein
LSKIQKWRRLGLVYAPRNLGPWGVSHAALPTVMQVQDEVVRAFFSVRDSENRSSLASIDIALTDCRFELAGSVRGPLLSPGRRGEFDADGVTVSCVARTGDALRAYYLGWTVGARVPFTNFIGLAYAADADAPFERRRRTPVVDRSEINPLSLGYPWVVQCDGLWRMWFGTHLCWGQQGLEMRHVIRAASSIDGETWEQRPAVSIPLLGEADPAEYAVSRPIVVRDGGQWSMWYARRNPDYRLGYAHSADGENWTRRDDLVTLIGKPGDWEATMQTYPCVFDHNGRRYMLYNGDGFGRTGFGLAVLDD